MTTTFAKRTSLCPERPTATHRAPRKTDIADLGDILSVSRNRQAVVNKRDLHRNAARLGGDLFADEVMAGDADQFGLEPAAKDAGLGVAAGPGQRPAAQRPIDVDVAVGDDLGAGADRGGDDQIGAAVQIALVDDRLTISRN